MSRLGYYVKLPSGETVTPFDLNLFYPNGGRITDYIESEGIQVVDQTGMDYDVLVRESVSADHTTLSSDELRRAKEAFTLHVDGDVSPLDFPDIAAVLQEQVRGV